MNTRRRTEREVWQALRALVLERNERRREVCEALDLSFVRVKALRRVAGGPMTMRELAAALMTDRPYTTLVVDDLERRGLVARTPHPGDRRAKIVGATAEGKREARRANGILATPPTQFRDLCEEDLADLHRIVGKLVE